jgi:hypothetical protein
MELSKEEWLRHAKFELEFCGEVPELVEFYLKVVEVFWEYNHDERSLYFTPETIEKLIRHENLRALTDSPFEWDDLGNGVWRNKRNPTCYSNDGGRTKVVFPPLDSNMDSNVLSQGLPDISKQQLEKLKDL